MLSITSSSSFYLISVFADSAVLDYPDYRIREADEGMAESFDYDCLILELEGDITTVLVLVIFEADGDT